MSGFGRRLQQGISSSSTTPPTGGDLSSLQRVPWHGGPAYFASYYNPGLLTDPNTVPIFEWYGNVDSDSVDQEKALGINGFLAVTQPTSLAVVRDAGLVAIPSYGEYTGTPGSETVGWHGDDEPDMNYGPGWASGQGFNDLQSVESSLPNDNRVVHNNFGKGIMYWESDSDAATFINGGDTTGSWRQGLVSADLYWYAGIQSLSGDGASYLGLASDQIARSQNYGMMIDRQRYLQGVGSRAVLRPIYGFVEASHPYNDGSMPTPLQLEGAVWNSFIHEAAGIFFFHHSFLDTFAAWDASTQYKLGDNVTYNGNNYCAANLITPTMGTVPTSDSAWVGPVYESSVGMRNLMVPGMGAHITDLTARIQALAPVLNSQSYVWTCNIDLETMLKAPGDGYAYIFAMQDINHTSGSYTLTLPTGVTGTSIEVINESRNLTAVYDTYAKTFTYTGAAQSWTVPAGVTSITVDLYGAAGAGAGEPAIPGRGGHVQATIAVTPGETLQINVGGQGGFGAGGWNGGGTSTGSTGGDGGGGGASDIRRGGTTLSNRILVAGGGGGTALAGGYGNGGDGGGLIGASGVGDDGGDGGTQSAGGVGNGSGGDGALGQGGSTTVDGAGGGGGYYGGGASGWYHGGGGGGSSYIDPSATDITNEQGIQLGNGIITIKTDQIPAENLTFTDTFAAEYTCHIYKIKL